ncbi:MAG: hypothetical protein GXY96_04185 [Tissierellia bacterium]|nr:hypothetical protein [Tissierellia bacterium]
MLKKLMASLLLFIIILSTSTVGFAAKANASKYQVIIPEEDLSATQKKVVLISGKAPQGTSITIDVYGAIDLTGKKYSLIKLPEDDAYTLISSKTIEAGSLGFGEEVELILGVNKIIVKFNVEGAPVIEKILYYFEKEQVERSLRNTHITPIRK